MSRLWERTRGRAEASSLHRVKRETKDAGAHVSLSAAEEPKNERRIILGQPLPAGGTLSSNRRRFIKRGMPENIPPCRAKGAAATGNTFSPSPATSCVALGTARRPPAQPAAPAFTPGNAGAGAPRRHPHRRGRLGSPCQHESRWECPWPRGPGCPCPAAALDPCLDPSPGVGVNPSHQAAPRTASSPAWGCSRVLCSRFLAPLPVTDAGERSSRCRDSAARRSAAPRSGLSPKPLHNAAA